MRQAISVFIAAGLITGSCAALAYVVRKLLRREPLVPFVERDDLDPGGVLSWIRLAVAAQRGETPQPILAWDAKQFWSDVCLGTVAFFAAFLPVILVHAFLQQFVEYEHPVIKELQSNRSLGLFLRLAVVTVLFAPLLEELLFRNLLQGMLEVSERLIVRRLGADQRWIFGSVPIFLSSLAFATAHWDQGAAPAPLLLFALVLGYLYFQTHRLTPSVIAHSLLNGFTMLQLWFLET